MKNGQQHANLCISAPKPVHSMLAKAVKGQSKGAKSRLVSYCVAQTLGPKYPKDLSEFNKLHGYE